MGQKDLVQITKEYYDSKEADAFHSQVWGGEDIHIGIYQDADMTIKEAARDTILSMVKKLPSIKKTHRILDIGSGFGGAARYLAQEYGCHVDCFNLSEQENQRNREKNKKAGLEDLISVQTGNFETIPFDRESYDVVWSQDALVHTNKKRKVFLEVFRVLKPGGRFIFTDLMENDDCPDGVLKKLMDHLHLEEMGSVKSYRRLARRVGLEKVFIQEMPDQLTTHYAKILETLESQYDKIVKKSGKPYLEKMKNELQYWIDAGNKGYLNWGILQFQKQN